MIRRRHSFLPALVSLMMGLVSCGPGNGGVTGKARSPKGGVPGLESTSIIKGRPGSRCNQDSDCMPLLTCQRGACATGPAIAYVQGCSDDLQCEFPAVCVEGACEVAGAPEGAPCTHDSECAVMHGCMDGICEPIDKQGSMVGYEPPGPGAFPFVDGEAPAAMMESCETDDDCPEGSGCHLDLCQPHSGGQDVGDGCQATAECNLGLLCIEGGCTRRDLLGQECIDGFDCLMLFDCIGGTCSSQGVMVGEVCAHTLDCFSESEIVVCLEGTCTPIGSGKPGDVCELEEDCEPPLVCSSYLCAQHKAASGEACIDDDHCQEGFCVGGICSERLNQVTEPCGHHLDCESGLCVKAKCADYLDTGAKCKYDTECLSMVCVNGKCADAPQAVSEKCKKDTDCQLPLVCIKNKCRDHRSAVGEICAKSGDCMPGLECKLGKCRG